VHAVTPAAEKEPLAHVTQAVPVEYLPAAHVVQAVAQAADMDPEAHLKLQHADCCLFGP